MAAPTYVGAGALTSSTAGITIDIPAGNVGDLLIALVESNVNTVATPAGWTLHTGPISLTGFCYFSIFYRFATGSDTCTVADVGDHLVGRMFRLRGVNSANAINVSANGSVSGSASISAPSVTTTVNNCMAVICLCSDRDTTAATWGGYTNSNVTWTEDADSGTTAGSGACLGFAHAVLPTAGALGTTSITNASIGTNTIAVTIALEPTPIPLFDTLKDDFAGTTIDTAKWTAFTSSANSHVTQNNVLTVDHYGTDTSSTTPYPKTGVKSAIGYKLTGSSVFAQLTPYNSNSSDWGMMENIFAIINETGNEGVGFAVNPKLGRLYFKIWNDLASEWTQADPATYIAYSATNHKFLRIRESAGTIYWDTAPDNGSGQPGTWTNQASALTSSFTNFDSVTNFLAESRLYMFTWARDAAMLDSYITADATFDTINGGSGTVPVGLAAAGTGVATGSATAKADMAASAAGAGVATGTAALDINNAPPIDAIAEIKALRIPSGPYLGGYELAPNGKLNWYFTNLALRRLVPYLTANDLDTYVRVYLDLYISKLKANNSIDDVNFTVGRADPTQFTLVRSDSDDSYAASFLSVAYSYYKASGNTAWFTTNLTKLKDIAYSNLVTQIKVSGLCRVYQSPDANDIGYLMDNCEVYSGLKDFGALLTALGDPDASYYNSFVPSVAAGIATLWDSTANAYKPSDAHTAAETTFYPGTTCQVFPQALGVTEESARFTLAYSYLNTNSPNWPALVYDAYPWDILGYVAFLRGDGPTKTEQQRQATENLFVSNRAHVTINELGWYLAYVARDLGVTGTGVVTGSAALNVTSATTAQLAASGAGVVKGTASLSGGTASGVSFVANPQSGTGYAFGSKLDVYQHGIGLTGITQTDQDNFVKGHYDAWKAARIVTNIPTIPGGYADQFSNTSALCVSEGMGYAMLIVVHMAGYDPDARTIFDGLLTTVRARPAFNVTRDMNNQGRTADSWVGNYLMEWKLNPDGSSINDGYNAADGDMDIALALMMAGRQWGNNGAWNYDQEAANTIYALKVWNFSKSDGTLVHWPIYGRMGYSDETRLSDFMYQSFRSYAEHMGDTFWTDCITYLQGKTNYIQTTISSAGLVPDFIRGMDANPYLTATTEGDPGLNAQEYSYNSCRVPWRWGVDYLIYGDASTKTQSDRLTSFFKAKYDAAGTNDMSAAMTAVDTGYAMDGTTTAGGDSAAFMGPVMVSCMTDAAYQSLGNSLWAWCSRNVSGSYPNRITAYFDGEIELMSELIVTKNWFMARTPNLTQGYGAAGHGIATGTAALNVQIGGGGGGALSSFGDTFTGTVIDTAKWTVFTSSVNSAVTQNNELIVHHYGNDNNGGATPYPKTGVQSANSYPVTGDSVYAAMTPYTSTSSDFGMMYQDFALLNSSGEGVGFEYLKAGAGRLYMRIWNDFDTSWMDTDPAAYLTYSATDHKFLRIRESGGTIYWDTAPDDGTGKPGTWTNRASKAHNTFTNFSDLNGFLNTSKVFMCVRAVDAGMLDSYYTSYAKYDEVNGGGSSTAVLKELQAPGTGVATGTAGLKTDKPLSAAGQGSGAGTAGLYNTGITNLGASGAGQGTGTAGLEDKKDLGAAGSGTGTGSAALNNQIDVAGSGAGQGTGTAGLKDDKNLGASGAGVGTGSADLTDTKNYQLGASGAGTGAGTADLKHDVPLAGGGAGQGTGTSALKADKPLDAAGGGQGTGSANLLTGNQLDAHGAGQGTGGAALQDDKPLAGGGAGTGTGGATLDHTVPLAGSGAGTGTGTGGVNLQVNLSGSGSGQGTGTADLSTIGRATATANLLETGSDVASGDAKVLVQGSLDYIEANDTASGYAKVIVGVDAVLHEVGADSASSAAKVLVRGSGALVEQGTDTLSGTSGSVVVGSGALVESPDTVTSDARVFVKGSGAIVEGTADSLSGQVYTRITANAALHETATADSASGVALTKISAAASLQESAAKDTVSANARVRVIVTSAALVETGADTLVGTSGSSIVGYGTITEAGSDTASGDAKTLVHASGAAIEATLDIANGVATAIVTANAAVTETQRDTMTATASVAIKGSGAATETAEDTLTATTARVRVIAQNVTLQEQGVDTASGTATAPTTGGGALVETGSDTAAGAGQVLVSAVATLVESAGGDSASGSGIVYVQAVAQVVEGLTDQISCVSSVLVQATMVAVESGADVLQGTALLNIAVTYPLADKAQSYPLALVQDYPLEGQEQTYPL